MGKDRERRGKTHAHKHAKKGGAPTIPDNASARASGDNASGDSAPGDSANPVGVVEKGSFATAICDCGWRGPGRRARKRARADADAHLASPAHQG